MIAATLMVMMPWEAPRRSGYDACVAPEDAALEAALRRSSRRGRATRRIGAGVACVLLLAVASSAARSRDGLRTREMDVVAPEGCGGAARFDVAARFTAGSAGAMTFKDGAAVKLAYYEKGARKEACDTHTIYVELASDDAGLRAALDAVSSPTSPDFRKFWTPEETKSFVVGDGDRVEAWLRSFGAETARASDAFVRATGPAFVFEAAFGCELYRFDAPHRSVDRCDGGYAVHDDIFKRRASSSKPKPPAPRPAPAPAAPKPPPSREVERLASFLKEALDDAEPPRDAAADERKARQRAAEDAKAIAELERGAASVRDFHRARTADRRRPSAREPRFQQSQTSPRLP